MRVEVLGRKRVRGLLSLKVLQPHFEKLASRILCRKGMVAVVAIGERHMAYLNRQYKGRKGPAEILTFDYRKSPIMHDDLLGEILLCWHRVEKTAGELGVSRKAYALRLVAHGLMHLAGYRHDSPEKELEMQVAEEKALRGLLDKRTLERLFVRGES